MAFERGDFERVRFRGGGAFEKVSLRMGSLRGFHCVKETVIVSAKCSRANVHALMKNYTC